jgi:hypothetical protein
MPLALPLLFSLDALKFARQTRAKSSLTTKKFANLTGNIVLSQLNPVQVRTRNKLC